MSDPDKSPEPAEAAPEKTLDETTPPMKLQQKSLRPFDLEPLDKTTPETREPSQDPPRRRT